MTAPVISGATRFAVMLGDPIVQVKTPTLFAEWAAQNAVDAIMTPMQATPETLGDTLRALRGWRNCAGAVVTYPHKQAVAEALDQRSTAVSVLGACNVVRREADGRLIGEMTDGLGFVEALRANAHDVTGRDALLVGAGGAGSAIALALLEAGVGRLRISDIDAARRDDLIERLSRARPQAEIFDAPPADFECGLVCNATPVGMNEDLSHPWPLDELPKNCIVADIVPNPPRSRWVVEAARRGHPVQTGPQMVAGQLRAIVSHLFPEWS